MRKTNLKILSVVVLGTLPLSACMYSPDHFSTNRLQVEQTDFSQTIEAASINDASANSIASAYNRNGDGAFKMTVLYDPAQQGGAMKATDEAARISSLLRKNNVRHVESGILPLNGNGPDIKVLMTYNAYAALAPKDCNLMPGINTRTIEADPDQKLGCTVDTLYARQIARPKDLRGQSSMEDSSDGRRASNIVDRYRTGEPNEPLDGQSASGDD